MFEFFDTVIGFFKSFGEYLHLAFSWIGTIVGGIFQAIALIGNSLTFTQTVVGFMPLFISSAFFIFIFIYLIKFFVGR